MNNLRAKPVWLQDPGGYYPVMNDDSRLEKIGFAAAGIAHDINNQLNLIVNHLSIPDEDGRGVADARQAAQRCAALTGSLLSYCQTTRMEDQSLDPAKLVRRFVNETPLPTGINLELDVPFSLPLMRANAISVLRALTNLASNACDAMNNCGTLRIAATAQQIDVTDSGPGIPAEVMRHMFEPFTSTKKEAGYGLGLAIVRELMREMGGYAAVASEPGVGTTFTLRFRAA